LLRQRTVFASLLELLVRVGVVDGDPALIAADEIAKTFSAVINKHRAPAAVAWFGRRPALDIIRFEGRVADGTWRADGADVFAADPRVGRAQPHSVDRLVI
jgi:hypothetical protein